MVGIARCAVGESEGADERQGALYAGDIGDDEATVWGSGGIRQRCARLRG